MISKIFYFALSLAICLSFTSIDVSAQKGKGKIPPKKTAVAPKTTPTPDPDLPKVTQIDSIGLQNLLKREGENPKPLLINFWATWCGPCVAEFPDLVKIDNDYKGKIDFITVTLDDLADIDTVVPRFLKKMNAGMPTYLLKTDDEGAAISMVDKDLSGALPITILFDGTGKVAYKHQAKIVVEKLRSELDKLIPSQITELPQPKKLSGTDGEIDAKNDVAKGQFRIKRYGLTPAIPQNSLQELKVKYGIEVMENGCVLINTTPEYFTAYNEVMKSAIAKKFGHEVLKKLPL